VLRCFSGKFPATTPHKSFEFYFSVTGAVYFGWVVAGFGRYFLEAVEAALNGLYRAADVAAGK
jgi:hypothetical protein